MRIIRRTGKLERAGRGGAALTLAALLLCGGFGGNAQALALKSQMQKCGTYFDSWADHEEQVTAQQTESAQEQNLPLVLVFTPRQAGAKFSAKNDPNTALRILLRDALRESGHYRALSFQANDPVVVRALREHTLASADIVEPISPEAMQRIAAAFGAKNILSLDAALNSTTLTAQARLLGSGDGDTWRVIYDEKTTTALTMGRRKLKFAEAIDVAAEPILTRLGLSSRMARDMKTEKTIQITKPTKDEKAALALAERERKEKIKQDKLDQADKDRAARIAQNGAAKTGANPPEKTSPPAVPDARNNPPAANSANTPPKNTNAAPKSASGKSAPLAVEPGSFTAFSTDGAAGRDVLPARPDVAPPPALAPVDIEAAITRYRQAGDMANVITSLRRAINDRPRDTLLRRQLIQAYQDRQMNDAALEETSRALLLLPEDAGLRRMQGDSLLAKGDINGALAAYRDAIKRDPGDVSAQVALADALLADSQTAEAQTAYQAAVKTDPKSPLPHRRLANALARRAVGDSSLYAASLDELKQARALTPAADSAYLDDYTGLARLMEARLRDLLNELQNDFQAQQQGKMTGDALKRALADLKLRGEAAADYLDKLPPAPGHDVTHAHYQQGAALLLQAVSLFRDYAAKPDDATLTAMKGAQTDAHRELAAGAKSLLAAKSDAP